MYKMEGISTMPVSCSGVNEFEERDWSHADYVLTKSSWSKCGCAQYTLRTVWS